MTTPKDSLDIYYDGQCPFCRNYVHVLELKKHYTVQIHNAREAKEKMKEFLLKGYDINEGMIVCVNETAVYHGAQAVTFLNKCTTKKAFIYETKLFKYVGYPCLKVLRKCILFIGGKSTRI